MTTILYVRLTALICILGIGVSAYAAESDWLRPAKADDPLIWGHKNGVVFGLRSEGGMRGPRGLIRVGIRGKNGEAELINFIAVEPVVKGDGPRHTRLALSELETSLSDGQQGKLMWTDDFDGELTTGSHERLSVRIEVEPFQSNGAHVYVIATVDGKKPHELQLAVHHHEQSKPIEELTVTATMGNYERLRELWLKDKVVSSLELYKDYTGTDFVESHPYPLKEMRRNETDDPVVFATTNEDDPTSWPYARRSSWEYKSIKLTQYWRVPKEHVEDNLRVRVNGRRVYWASKNPIPNGISFENFEVRQSYEPGQVFVFGLTPNAPPGHDPN